MATKINVSLLDKSMIHSTIAVNSISIFGIAFCIANYFFNK